MKSLVEEGGVLLQASERLLGGLQEKAEREAGGAADRRYFNRCCGDPAEWKKRVRALLLVLAGFASVGELRYLLQETIKSWLLGGRTNQHAASAACRFYMTLAW